MKISTTNAPAAGLDTDALILAIPEDADKPTPWEAVDAVKIGKAIAASLSLDIDTGPTQDLFSYIGAGIANSFDGQTLFAEDVYRSAPMDPASTVPDATNGTPFAVEWNADNVTQLAHAAEAAARVSKKMEEHPLFKLALDLSSHIGLGPEWRASDGGANQCKVDPRLPKVWPNEFMFDLVEAVGPTGEHPAFPVPAFP